MNKRELLKKKINKRYIDKMFKIEDNLCIILFRNPKHLEINGIKI